MPVIFENIVEFASVGKFDSIEHSKANLEINLQIGIKSSDKPE
jgi:hypothetical protein